MRILLTFIAALALATPAAAQTAPGRLSGGIHYTLPTWFKQSFLDFREDVAEAAKQNRHVLVFLHLDECPYCARMLSENFVRGENHDFLRQHFDVVAVNVRGGLDVAWVDGKQYSERTLTRHLKVFGTPTLVFLGPDGRTVLQLGGYRDPRALREALEFVQSRGYLKGTFAAHLGQRAGAAAWTLRDHPQFARITDFSQVTGPLAVLWEDPGCVDCARFHDRTLSRPDVAAEMKRLTFVRLDAGATTPIVDVAGRATTPAQWVKALGLTYRPGLVLYDGGREIFRVDSLLYHFHFRETLRYVSGGHYQRYATISQYHAARRAELLKQGVSIDYSE